jgi:MarR family transcriptional regulator for hemolysin
MVRLDPYESLGFHCSLTYKAFVTALDRKLKGKGVSPAQFIALAHLVALGPISQVEVADRLSITPATAVRLVDRMERDGWVIRQSDPDDARVKLVAPTEKAKNIWDELSEEGRNLLDQAYTGVHPAELEMVKRVLARVRQNLKD